MKYGSVCSGIEAATNAWRPLGWECAFVSEVEPFPCAVLSERLGASRPWRMLDPSEAETEKDRKLRRSWIKGVETLPAKGEIPNFGDFTKIDPGDYEGDIDLLVGGTPCQAFSIAGLRKGLEDARGNLALEFAKLAFRTHCRWVVWENVTGVFSSGKGRDFAAFLSLLTGWEVPVPEGGWKRGGIVTNAPGGFGVAWRVIDAQYARVEQFPRAIPQRRKRVILVGSLGSWTGPRKVLFDGELCGGFTEPVRTTGKTVAAGDGASAEGAGGTVTWWDGAAQADTITTRSHGQYMPDKHQLQCVIDTRWYTSATDGSVPALLSTDYKDPKAVLVPCYPLDMTNIDGRTNKLDARCYDDDGTAAYTITKRRASAVCTPGVVRKLLPLECERLMGFPDGWTKIPWRGKPASECPDGPRYKALGYSMCVNVMSWIGHRIDDVDKGMRDEVEG